MNKDNNWKEVSQDISKISNKIKDIFPKYNFSYHTIHLKQVAEPNKYINILISCP